MAEKIPDEVYNGNWNTILKMFHKINRSEEGAVEKYQSLIELARTKVLTPRQSEGITARCKYQLRLITNPSEAPFSNSERKEDRNTYQLYQTE